MRTISQRHVTIEYKMQSIVKYSTVIVNEYSLENRRESGSVRFIKLIEVDTSYW